jgi:hypothetical protein
LIKKIKLKRTWILEKLKKNQAIFLKEKLKFKERQFVKFMEVIWVLLNLMGLDIGMLQNTYLLRVKLYKVNWEVIIAKEWIK